MLDRQLIRKLVVGFLILGCRDPAADLVVFNGNVITLGDPPAAEALAVRDGRIVRVGTSTEVLELAGPSTERIDIGGRTVIPGLGDNHFHAVGGGPGVDLSSARSIDDVITAIGARAAETPDGGVILTNSNWHEGQLSEQRLPLRDDLDRATRVHPVVVVRGGHEYILNSAALAHWSIGADTKDIPGGRIGRYENGRLNGELVDRAKSLVRLPPTPPPDRNAMLNRLVEEHQVLNSVGLTSVRYAGGSAEQYELLRELRDTGRLTVRVNFLLRPRSGAGAGAGLDSVLSTWTPLRDQGDEWLRVGGIKLGVDGGFEGGWMRDPYEEPWGQAGTFSGLQTMPTDEYTNMVLRLNEAGWRVATHAVGDAAIDLVLDAYEQANARRSIVGRRWVIEHGFIPRPDQFPRIRDLGLHVSAQNHLYVAAPSLDAYWGRQRAEWTTPVKAYRDAGIPVSAGTDSPVIPYNPFWVLYHFSTRQTISAGVMGADQRVDRIDALKLATIDHASLTFEEDVRGTLEPGKFGDFVVLDADLLTSSDDALRDMTVHMTVVGGRIVHDGREP